MSDIKIYLKNRLSELAVAYRTNAELSVLAIARNDFSSVKFLFNELQHIFERVLNIAETAKEDENIKQVLNQQMTDLPDYLQAITVIDAYRKLLSLKYTNYKSDNQEEMISVNKMSIELNNEGEIPYLITGRVLYENKHYAEALRLCEYIETYYPCAPVWSLYSDIYRELGEYGLAIQSCLKYLELNKNDEEETEKLEKLYEEALA